MGCNEKKTDVKGGIRVHCETMLTNENKISHTNLFDCICAFSLVCYSGSDWLIDAVVRSCRNVAYCVSRDMHLDRPETCTRTPKDVPHLCHCVVTISAYTIVQVVLTGLKL